MTTESSGFPALRNGLDVLRAFDAGHDRLGVVELAERTGLHKSTVSRLLVALEDEGLVERDEQSRKYSLGLGLVLLGVALRLREPEAFGLLALVIIFQLVTSPVASHMIGRAAVRTDNRGEERLVVDELSEDRPQGRADEGDVPDQR